MWYLIKFLIGNVHPGNAEFMGILYSHQEMFTHLILYSFLFDLCAPISFDVFQIIKFIV